MATVQLPDGSVVDLNKPAVPSGSEVADWANQRSQLSTSLANANAQADAARAAAQSQYNVTNADLAQKYTQLRNNLPTGYAKRGLLNSGIYHEGLQNYAVDRANAYAKAAQAYQSQLGTTNAAAAGAYGNFITGNQSVNRSEFARRADLASALRGM